MIRLCEITTTLTTGDPGSAESTTVTPDLNGVIEKIIVHNPDEEIFRLGIKNAALEILLWTDIVETTRSVFTPMLPVHNYLGAILNGEHVQQVVAGPLTVLIMNADPDVSLSLDFYVN